MESLIIEQNPKDRSVPLVNFSKETGECRIEGESFMENANAFYDMLQNWLRAFIEETSIGLSLHFKLTYFNTASSKALLDMLVMISRWERSHDRFVVYWHYPNPDEEDILIEGEELKDDTNLPFRFVEYEA